MKIFVSKDFFPTFFLQKFSFKFIFEKFFLHEDRPFLNNYTAPSFLIQLYVNWLKIINVVRAIACVKMRPFQLKSGKKYGMLHGRKVAYFPPL